MVLKLKAHGDGSCSTCPYYRVRQGWRYHPVVGTFRKRLKPFSTKCDQWIFVTAWKTSSNEIFFGYRHCGLLSVASSFSLCQACLPVRMVPDTWNGWWMNTLSLLNLVIFWCTCTFRPSINGGMQLFTHFTNWFLKRKPFTTWFRGMLHSSILIRARTRSRVVTLTIGI